MKTYKFTEIYKLQGMLDVAQIPYEFVDESTDTYTHLHLCVPTCDEHKRICSAIQSSGSYGREEDKIEIMGLLTPREYDDDSVKGWLSAEEVFERIKSHYDCNKLQD